MTASLTFSLPLFHTSGYVAVDAPRKLIVVAYRGTILRDLVSVAANFASRGFQRAAAYCPGCRVAIGYLTEFNESRQFVIPAVEAALLANPKFQVVTTGHSLGGAVATIAALELRSLGIPVHAVGVCLQLGDC